MPSDVAGAIQDAYAAAGPPSNPIADAINDAYQAASEGNHSASSATPTPSAPSRSDRFVQGLTDLPTGLGQIAEHVAETPLNWVRAGIRKGLNAAGAPDAAALFTPESTQDFDKIVADREAEYQSARDAAGQKGIDWWRLGGQAANPLNYAVPGGAAGSVGGRILQAGAQGAAIGAAQPSATPGDFWLDKAKGAGVGAAAGAGTAGVIEGALPALKWATSAITSKSGLLGSDAAAQNAESVVNETLKAKGVDPSTLDLNVLKGMRAEVAEALQHGVTPDAGMIAARAKAEPLPVPIQLTRGQASGDPMQFSTEQNLRGITGVGEKMTQRLQDQKNAAYAAVRNSKRQPAALDQFTATKNIRNALDTPQASYAFQNLPQNIQKTIGDLEDGKLPLTVAQLQQLDTDWSAQARGADGSTAYAINKARSILADAPISDSVGKDAMKAWQSAKALHAQQMSLVEPKLANGAPNPNFQPLVKAVVMDGKPPESLFQTHFMGSAPSTATKNLQFLNGLNLDAPETIGKTFMGEIKRQSLSSASDERGTVSQGVINKFANDPVNSARLDALLPKPAADTFRNLADTVEAAKRFPVASTVNTSNTGSAVVNAVTSGLKAGAMEKLGHWASVVPGLSTAAKTAAEALKQGRLERAALSALHPGVTLQQLMSLSPEQRAVRAGAARVLMPEAVSAAMDQQK